MKEGIPMKYVTPEYKLEVISSEDIMEFSPNDIAVTETNYDFNGDGIVDKGFKGTASASILDLLFG